MQGNRAVPKDPFAELLEAEEVRGSGCGWGGVGRVGDWGGFD